MILNNLPLAPDYLLCHRSLNAIKIKNGEPTVDRNKYSMKTAVPLSFCRFG